MIKDIVNNVMAKKETKEFLDALKNKQIKLVPGKWSSIVDIMTEAREIGSLDIDHEEGRAQVEIEDVDPFFIPLDKLTPYLGEYYRELPRIIKEASEISYYGFGGDD